MTESERKRRWRAQRSARGISAHNRPYVRDPQAEFIITTLEAEHPDLFRSLRTRAETETP